MTHRIRIVVAIAILFALAAHPLEHPLVKESPCVHSAATAATGRADVLLAPVYTRRRSSAASATLPLKDLAPLPGRDIGVSYRLTF